MESSTEVEEFIHAIKLAGNLGVRILDIYFSYRVPQGGLDSYLSLITALGQAGIRVLNLNNNSLFNSTEILESKNPVEEIFMRIITVAVASGIRILHLGGIYRGEKLSEESMQQLTDMARLHNFKLGFRAREYDDYVTIS